MKLFGCVLLCALVTSSFPALACGPDAAPPEEALPGARVVSGTAMRLDERVPSAPILYISYPMEPGQTHQKLYGAFVQLVDNRMLDRLRRRLSQTEVPRVLLTRARPSGAWRVAAFLE